MSMVLREMLGEEYNRDYKIAKLDPYICYQDRILRSDLAASCFFIEEASHPRRTFTSALPHETRIAVTEPRRATVDGIR